MLYVLRGSLILWIELCASAFEFVKIIFLQAGVTTIWFIHV